MNEPMFSYAPFGHRSEAEILPAPIWPDASPESPMSLKMREAKKANDQNFWATMREVIGYDVETLPHHRFKMWASVWMVPIISQMKIYEFIKTVLVEVERTPGMAAALQDPGVGCLPEEFKQIALFDDYKTTMNRLQMFAHLINTGVHNDLHRMESIIELGAGIGEMADVIFQSHASPEYYIYDFPELLQLQKIHHDLLGPERIDPEKMNYCSEVEDLPQDADLVIATFSITEMPYDLRKQILEQIGKAKNWLIMYSDTIFGYENNKWVQEVFLPRIQDTHEHRFIEAPYMAWDGGTKYLVVRSK